MLNAIVFVITGKPFIQTKSRFINKDENNPDSFDDFEEINDEK
jgi:hypothetical protein